MHKFKLILLLILVTMVIVLVVQNTQPVNTSFLFITVTMPAAALLALTVLTGFACGILAVIALRQRPESPA